MATSGLLKSGSDTSLLAANDVAFFGGQRLTPVQQQAISNATDSSKSPPGTLAGIGSAASSLATIGKVAGAVSKDSGLYGAASDLGKVASFISDPMGAAVSLGLSSLGAPNSVVAAASGGLNAARTGGDVAMSALRSGLPSALTEVGAPAAVIGGVMGGFNAANNNMSTTEGITKGALSAGATGAIYAAVPGLALVNAGLQLFDGPSLTSIVNDVIDWGDTLGNFSDSAKAANSVNDHMTNVFGVDADYTAKDARDLGWVDGTKSNLTNNAMNIAQDAFRAQEIADQNKVKTPADTPAETPVNTDDALADFDATQVATDDDALSAFDATQMTDDAALSAFDATQLGDSFSSGSGWGGTVSSGGYSGNGYGGGTTTHTSAGGSDPG